MLFPFDVFKRKQTAGSNPVMSLSSFTPYYLYGFTQNPNNVADDKHLFGELYQLVIGEIGGIAINNSFHPYFIINSKGTTVWNAAYVKVYVNDNQAEVFNAIQTSKAVYTVDLSTLFPEVNVWPDTRLTYEENPLFSTYAPFVIPFLVDSQNKGIRWDAEIAKEVAENGHASAYVERVTKALRFFMAEPAFVIGFDEFDEKNPSGLIDNFIKCKRLLSGQ
ncbi:hypothetical protein GCM10028819_09880 [Spirosoma humi]